VIFTALSLNVTRDQVAIAEQGQITERYSRAIEQLGQQGPARVQMRLGGIYALERVTHDSPRDQPTIVEVLGAFIRTNAPKVTAPRLRFATDTSRPYRCPAGSSASPSPDVQAALTVLGRRDATRDGYAGVDLSYLCLDGADLRGAHLRGVNLWRASLSAARLDGADISGAVLTGTNFIDSGLGHADLHNSKMQEAHLENTSLGDADLRKAILDDAYVTGSVLSRANLADAELNYTHAHNAVFQEAVLTRAYLQAADLSGAQIIRADFTNAYLGDANLLGVERGTLRDEAPVMNGARTNAETDGEWW
jgi:uncharacterized protein YjbI with pentapeptide repeats